MSGLNLDVVRHALETAQEYGFAEVEVGSGEGSFRATLQPGPRAKAASPPAGDAKPEMPEFATIRSALVGFFHRGAAPLETGRRVKRGDVVGIINALGIANDVESTVDGEVVEVLVHDGQAVEFGQTLAKVKP